MRNLCAAAIALVLVACTVEDAIPRRPDAGLSDSGLDVDASKGGSSGASGASGSDAGGGAGDWDASDAPQQDSSGGEGGTDSEAGSGGQAGADAAEEPETPGCAAGEVECNVPGAPLCWSAGTDCSTLTDCKGNWAACAQDFTPHCGDVRGFACCPTSLPVFCDVNGPAFACWEQGIDCSTVTECSGQWFACPGGQKYICNQGCKGN